MPTICSTVQSYLDHPYLDASMTSGSRRRPEHWVAQRGGLVELLTVPAALFGALAHLRGALYDRKWLSIRRVDAPVICVGNLTAGGTGKTPAVAWFVERLIARGWKPGVLSRGYRKGEGPGDEAKELAAQLDGVMHVEDPDRVAGAAQLVDAGVDAIVLDDGFQHRRLARDLDIVLVDATRPWGLPDPDDGGDQVRAYLPRGLLRESPSALRRAHGIVVTRSDSIPWNQLTQLEAELARLAPDLPIARAIHEPTELVDRNGTSRDLASLRGLDVDLVTGVGNPAAVEATLTELGARVIDHRSFKDHHPFVPGDLDGLGDRPVITTAKDAARLLESPALPVDMDLAVLHVRLQIVQGAEALDALLDTLPMSPAHLARQSLHAGLHG
jgi:tetraacyldisaccharide 4'-kinase